MMFQMLLADRLEWMILKLKAGTWERETAAALQEKGVAPVVLEGDPEQVAVDLADALAQEMLARGMLEGLDKPTPLQYRRGAIEVIVETQYPSDLIRQL